MTTASPAFGGTPAKQEASNNPALNQQAFARTLERNGLKERAGMTAVGTYLKTGLLLIFLVAAGAWGWSQVRIETIRGVEVAIQPAWTWLAFLFTFIFAIAGIFAGRWMALVAIGYALAQGALLGISARYFNMEWDGIVGQAIVATIAVFGATWLIYTLGFIKVTSKFVMGIMIAMGGLMLLYLTAWLLSLFGVRFNFLFAPTPLGIGFAVLIVILAALNLPIDFEFIKQASRAGAPKYMEWYGAFGLMLSIIWMYVSILRLLALLRSR
jgi:uncharacterized YccA/Bax inhibitor family protein